MEDYKGQRVDTRLGTFYVQPLTIADLLESSILKNKKSSVLDIGRTTLAKTVKNEKGNAINEMLFEILPQSEKDLIARAITGGKKLGNHKASTIYRLGSYVRDEIALLNDKTSKFESTLRPRLITARNHRAILNSISNLDHQLGRMHIPKASPGSGSSSRRGGAYAPTNSQDPNLRVEESTYEERAANAAEVTADRLNGLVEHMEALAQATGQLSATVATGLDEFMGNIQEQKEHAEETIRGTRISLFVAIFAVIFSAVLTILQIGLELYRDHTGGQHEQIADATQSAQLSALNNIQLALARPEEIPSVSFTPALELPSGLHLRR